MKKSYSQFINESYSTVFAQRIGRFGFSRYNILHKKSGNLAGVLSIDRASGDHHFHLANGRGYTLPKGHPDIQANATATTNKFMKKMANGEYDKSSGERTFGPFDWSGGK